MGFYPRLSTRKTFDLWAVSNESPEQTTCRDIQLPLIELAIKSVVKADTKFESVSLFGFKTSELDFSCTSRASALQPLLQATTKMLPVQYISCKNFQMEDANRHA